MRKIAAFIFSTILGAAFLSNTDKSSSLNFVFSTIEEVPTLPVTPFDYSVDFPDHILSIPDEPTGYSTMDPDTTLASAVTNDGATLGRVLFYDKKLSALEDLSCASCHLASQSFADNKSFSQGVSTLTSRNSMHLNDLGWTKNKGFFWDFRQDNLHTAINLPLTDANEIGADIEDISLKLANTSYYPPLFEKAYGEDVIDGNRIVDALVQFISSINSFNSKFDEGVASGFTNFTEAEKNGQELFATNCATCHSEGNSFGLIGIPDLSLEESIMIFPMILRNGLNEEPEDIGIGGWLDGMEGLFKSPTLRNIALTAPYMHDGRFETLDEVLDFYSEETVDDGWGGGFLPLGGLQFTDTEKAELKAFMLTLTDETLALNPKWQDPFSKVTNTDELDVNVKVMPNPMSLYSEVHIDNEAGDRVNITITDAMGKTVRTDYFTSSVYRIEKANFTPGIYYVSLMKANKLATYKLIVQ